MTYIGVNPYSNIRRFTETKPISSYPKEILNEIKLLSFSRDKTATPFGSYIYRLQKYPGDLDLVEEFTECCSLNDVVTKFSKALQNVVKKINKKRSHYFSEVKVGLDERYDIDIGEMIDGNYFPNPYLSYISNNLKNKKLLSKEENDIIQYIFSKVKKMGSLGPNEYDTIKYIFRERKILRWSDEEILKGIKKLPGNISVTLKKALEDKTHIKIDMIVDLNGRLVEITNFFQLAYIDKKDEIHLVNIDLEENHNIPVQLPIEIEKLYFSNMFYSPFKMVKRMYSLGRHNMDNNLLNKIIPFVSSNTSLLYQIKSEIDTIILILEKMKSYPKKLIFDQLDEAKSRISTVLEIPQDGLIQINNIIDDINNTAGKYDKINKLKKLKKLLVAYINMQTINYLQKNGLNPPPYKYLPPQHTYDINYKRAPGENPINPLKIYEDIIEKRAQGGINVYYPVNHHYPNFFEDPNSRAILSQKIISNPGLNEIPTIDILRRKAIDQKLEASLEGQVNAEILDEDLMRGEGGTRMGAWWSSFVRKYKNTYNKYPPITYDIFRKLFARRKKYDYGNMLQRIINFIQQPPRIIPQTVQEFPEIIPHTVEEIPEIIPQIVQEVPEIIPQTVQEVKHPHVVTIQPGKYIPERVITYKLPSVSPKKIEKEIYHDEDRIDKYHNENRFDKYFDNVLNRCENRTDKFIDHLLYMRSPNQEIPIITTTSSKNIPNQEFKTPPKPPVEITIEEERPKPPPAAPKPPPTAPKPPPPQILSKEEKEAMQKRREEAKQQQQQESGPPSLSSVAELVAEAARKRMQQKGIQAEGKIGGYAYSHNFRVPLYMNENLPIPKLQQNEMHLHPQTASSYASDYQWRGYGPSLKAVHIQNAPLVLNGQIMPYVRAGCDDCGLNNFRSIH